MNPGRWRLPGEYMPYGALTRLWSPVMTALLRAFLTLMVNCPTPAIFLFEPEKLLQIVREAVGSSALFAARFRECTARALLMPGRTPGHRTPLWQQRLRASQLLEIAQGYPDFPVILETLRECLQDVYDLPALERLMRRLNGGEIQISDVTTTTPSPFATSLCSAMSRNYVPERRPAGRAPGSVLSLDSELLRNLLGQVDPGELLDPQVIRQWKKSCNDWLLAEERKVKKDCSTCCANWGQ
ncbi:ATP-dependent helicase [Escherichia coli]|nr:ATP-dependent helicase [Escherichia coli]